MGFIEKLKIALLGTPEEQAQRRKDSERQMVENEVARIKQRAKNIGVDEIVGKLWNNIQHYPN